MNSNIISTNNVFGVGQASEMDKRPMLGIDERMVQQHPPVSSLSSRMMLPQSGVKSTDGDNGNGGEGGGMGTRVFSPSGVPGIQWRPGSSFQTQHEGIKERNLCRDSNKYNKEATPFLECINKVEALEDLVIIGPPGLVKGASVHEQSEETLSLSTLQIVTLFLPIMPLVLVKLIDNSLLDVSQSDLEANLFKLMERRGYGQEYINCYKMMTSSILNFPAAISKGLEKVVQELSMAENDGPVSEKFLKVKLMEERNMKPLDLNLAPLSARCNKDLELNLAKS
ncbi:unnamed protein product [Lactuca saligna]|uniref:Uncharacterized protein n=1 Tax=Lactuca saligna TaxID=75948 RepID=A0AA35VRC9_LACSI|nr:unnamed protein product [Lactuca saligna]